VKELLEEEVELFNSEYIVLLADDDDDDDDGSFTNNLGLHYYSS